MKTPQIFMLNGLSSQSTSDLQRLLSSSPYLGCCEVVERRGRASIILEEELNPGEDYRAAFSRIMEARKEVIEWLIDQQQIDRVVATMILDVSPDAAVFEIVCPDFPSELTGASKFSVSYEVWHPGDAQISDEAR
jgi:hypothetical protein